LVNQQKLIEYLDTNHGLYIEGNDWCADHRSTDLFAYFNIVYEGFSADNAVRQLDADQDCRFGEQSYSYANANDSGRRPDYIRVPDGSEEIFTCNQNNVRAAYFDGNNAYRTYSLSLSFLAIRNDRGFDRAEYLLDIIESLAGYRGTFTGRVIDRDEQPVTGAFVSLPGGYLGDTTDDNGEFEINRIPTEQFTITVQRWGYTTLDEADFNFDGERELYAEIMLRHPDLELDPVDIQVDVVQNTEAHVDITLSNPGDGPLEFTSRLRYTAAEGHLWDEMDGINIGATLEDTRLQAALFFQNHFWIAGGNSGRDNPNLLYKVTRDGQLVDSWEQGTESIYGWRDLTTDGEYIYGVDADYIAQIDPETGQVTDTPITCMVMPNPIHAVTYDPEAEVFWVSGPTSNILGITPQGRYVDVVNNNNRFRISGLAWYADDPDDHQLYITSTDEFRNPIMVKVNYQSETDLYVCHMDYYEDESPGGGDMSSELYPFTTCLVSQMQGPEDWLRLFESGTNFHWINITPTEADVDSNGCILIDLKLDATGFGFGECYEAHIQFDHNTPVEGPIWLDVTMTVIRQTAVEDDDLTPYKFGIASIYPNPFNPSTTVEFALDQATDVNLTVFDLSGRVMTTLVNDHLNAGKYSLSIAGYEWPSGVYVVRLADNLRVDMQKVTLIR